MSKKLTKSFVTGNLKVRNPTTAELHVYYTNEKKEKQAVVVEAGIIKDLAMYAPARAYATGNLEKLLNQRKLVLL